MNHFNRTLLIAASLLILGTGSATLIAGSAHAVASSDTQAERLQLIISRSDLEINRRLAKLQALSSKINAATKLTSSDKAAITNEVNAAISGLQALKTKIDADTTLANARVDAKSIVTEYRVYALIMPKVALLRAADAQQATEDKLSSLADKLQTVMTAKKNAGKDVTALQSSLDSMRSKISVARGILTSVQSKVLPLQPTDYNSDHAVLSGYASQLKTAHISNADALALAKQIAKDLKAL